MLQNKLMLKINVITLVPQLFTEHLNNLPFKRAVLNGTLAVNIINLRDFALDKYGTVDDKPYGGGVGMVLMPAPIYKALKSIYGEDFDNSVGSNGTRKHQIYIMSPRGKKFTQAQARKFCEQAINDTNNETSEITFICGRYEGIDERVSQKFATGEISIGDYVLSGGELPALVIMEAIARLLPGTLEKTAAANIESFENGLLEFPQYTRPENFLGNKVPDVLLSGNHAEIEKWRKSQMRKVTE